jgi:hypothetical protein
VQLAAPMPAMSTIGSEDVEDVLTENRMFVAAINDLDRRLEASERGREELLRELGAYREHAQQLRLLAAQAEGLPPEHTEPELTEPAPAPPFDPEDLFANPEDDRAVPVPTPRDV